MDDIFKLLLDVSETGLDLNRAIIDLSGVAEKLGVWKEMEPQFEVILQRAEAFTNRLQAFEAGVTAEVMGEPVVKGEPVWPTKH